MNLPPYSCVAGGGPSSCCCWLALPPPFSLFLTASSWVGCPACCLYPHTHTHTQTHTHTNTHTHTPTHTHMSCSVRQSHARLRALSADLGWLALVCAFVFIIIQMVLLIDFAYSWNEAWVGRMEDGSCCHKWGEHYCLPLFACARLLSFPVVVCQAANS